VQNWREGISKLAHFLSLAVFFISKVGACFLPLPSSDHSTAHDFQLSTSATSDHVKTELDETRSMLSAKWSAGALWLAAGTLCGSHAVRRTGFIFPKAHPASYPVGTGAHSLGAKWPGREADRSPSSSTSKMRGAVAPPPIRLHDVMLS